MKNPLKLFFAERKQAVRGSLTELDALREAIAEGEAKIVRMTNASIDLHEATDALDRWLDDAATEAISSLNPGASFSSRDPEYQCLKMPIVRRNFETGKGIEMVQDTSRAVQLLLGLIVATSREKIREVVVKQIEDFQQANPGLSTEGREQAITAERANLFTLAAEEELLLRALEEASVPVQRRPQASAALLLATSASLEKVIST